MSDNSSINTILGENSQYEGTLNIKGSMRIDGELKGSIVADSVVISKKARVIANITAANVVVGGKLEGNIISARLIKLQDQSQVIGDIETERLMIEEGALLQGKCTMKTK